MILLSFGHYPSAEIGIHIPHRYLKKRVGEVIQLSYR